MIRYLVVYTAVVRFSIAGLCMFCSFALITLSFARAYVSLPRINIVWSQSLYLVSLHDEKRGTDTKRAGYRMCRRNGLTSDSFVCRFFLLTLSSFVDRLSLAKYRTKDNEAPFLFAFPVFFHPPPVPPTLQIANVVFEKVDAHTVNTAVAGGTLFIHGGTIEGSGRLSFRKLQQQKKTLPPKPGANPAAVTLALPPTSPWEFLLLAMPRGVSCGTENRFGGYLCRAGNSEKFGGSCRPCYTDEEGWIIFMLGTPRLGTW